MQDATILSLAGIICLTLIIIMCINNGIDGVLLATVVAAIAGIVGYQVKARRNGI